MTEEERRDEFFELHKSKENLERDWQALLARTDRYGANIRYVLSVLENIKRMRGSGAREFPDLRYWPDSEMIRQLFNDCAENEKALVRVQHRIDNFRP